MCIKRVITLYNYKEREKMIEINNTIKIIQEYLNKECIYSKVIVEKAFCEMSDTLFIKVIFARKDLLCADVISKKIIDAFLRIVEISKCDDYQIYHEEKDYIKMKHVISFNLYFKECIDNE